MNKDAFGASEEQDTLTSCRILVADDDVAIRKLLMLALSSAGYVVEGVENGAEAWEALQVHHYDLLLTDNNMPKMSGMQLMGRVHESNLNLPVIMASASMSEALLSEENNLHPAAILLKPFELGKVLETVNSVLRSAEVGCAHHMAN